jgi:hypothetical protein
MFDVTELLARLVAIEQEDTPAIIGLPTVDAVPQWLYAQERTPFWINRVVTISDDTETVGDEGSLDAVIGEMGLIYGEPTAGIDAEVETAINALLPDLLLVLRKRLWLQSAAYPTPMAWLNQCRISLASNLTEFPPTPVGARRMGVLFRAHCQFFYPVEQDY